MQTTMLIEPTLVGRKQELEKLNEYLSSAFEGKGKTVFVSGTAGSGKSRLVNEFLESIPEKKITILSGWCLSNAAIPYFPFIEAFDAYYSAYTGKEDNLERNNPKLYEDFGKYPVYSEELTIRDWLRGPKGSENLRNESHNPQIWKDITFAVVTKALLAISSRKPTVVFVEDLHWADSASLSLIHYLARAIASARVLFLATFRSEELNVDSEGHPHPLVEVLRLMGRENLYNEIKLPDLSQDSVNNIAENMIGGKLDPEFAEKLSGESQGNPLFVVESLRMLSEHGSLVQESNRWFLSIDELGIPNKIRDVILRRLGTLKSSQRRVLDVASVIGEKFDVDLVAAVLNQDTLEVLETLNTISKATSLVCCQGECYKFDHSKSRETLYEEIPLPLKRAYHSRIAQKMESASKDTKELTVSNLAYHYVQSGNILKGLKYSLEAGEDALARFSNAEAIKHFNYILDTVSEAPEFANERTMAREGLGDSFFAKGLFEEALKAFELLGDSAESGIVRLRALRKAIVASRWRGDLLQSLELARKASEYASFDRLEYARVLMNKGWASCLRGNAKEGLAGLEEALGVFEEEYSLADAACALTQAASFGASFNEFPMEKCLRMGLRSIAIYEDLKDVRGQVEAYYFVSQIFSHCLLISEAQQMYEKGIKLGDKIADNNHVAWLFLYLGFVFEIVENLEDGVLAYSNGVQYAEKTDAFYVKSMLYANIVRLCARIGDFVRMNEFYEKLMKLLPEVNRTGSKLAIATGKGTMALHFAALNQFIEANQLSEESLEMMRSLNHYLFEAVLRRDYAWILTKQGRTEDAKAQSEEAEDLIGKLKRDFDHVDIQADLMAPRQVRTGKEWNIRLDIFNISTKTGTLIRIEDLIPEELEVTSSPSNVSLQKGSVVMNEKKLEPFKTESMRFTLQASKNSSFTLTPQITYVNEEGHLITVKLKPVSIVAQTGDLPENVLPGRVSTGFVDLDGILLGGMPEDYAVVLTAPICDECEQLIKRFLEAGAKNDDTTFYITADTGKARTLVEGIRSSFYLFVCNPRADVMIKSLPNVFKLKGIENLTELDISLLKAFRMLDQKRVGPKRVCIEIVSDVLLQHHAVITRKWLSELLPDLKYKGFTTIAVVNPEMHPQEEVQAILSLFDGEFKIYEKETEKGLKKILRITRLHSQRYLENELILS